MGWVGARRWKAARAAALAALATAALPGAVPARAGHVEAIDVSEATGFADFAHTYGTSVFDYDGDGWEDAFVVRHYDSFPRLMKNVGGTSFEDVTDVAFPGHPARRDYHDCPTADVDGNGRLDVYCTHGGGSGGIGQNPNELWLQSPAGTFSEQAAQWGVQDVWGRGRQAAFVHANADGRPDLYVTNQFPRKDGRWGGNQLFLNVGGESYRSAPEFGLNIRNGATAVQAVDWELDGDEDLLVCGQKGLRLYRNVEHRLFRNAKRMVGELDGVCRHGVMAPFNPGPRPDLAFIRGDRVLVHVLRRDGLRPRPAFARRVPGARRVAAGDVDADGRADLYALASAAFDENLPRDEQSDLPDVLLANGGDGRTFEGVPLPPLEQGIGESVNAIDFDRNGLTDFVVMNGLEDAIGPIRLIALYPSG